MKNIAVYGAGYVGLANGLVLSKVSKVTIIDINKTIIDNLNNGIVHIDDKKMKSEIKEYNNVQYKTNDEVDLNSFDLFILSLPTNYDEESNKFDTSYLDIQIEKIREITNTPILIKSTIPVGYTKTMNDKFGEVYFSPEFLREGSSLSDALNPTRIILSESKYEWIKDIFANSIDNNAKIILMPSTEAETVKLFSNTYLAMRVAFVNELDSFAQIKGLDAKKIIEGVSSDPRIGDQYFLPSSGYGGYCLPKDSKQLMQEFNSINMPNDLLEGIVKSNANRKENLVRVAMNNNANEITIYGIGHKPGVANYRNSQNIELAHKYKEAGIDVKIVDPNFAGETIEGFVIYEK